MSAEILRAGRHEMMLILGREFSAGLMALGLETSRERPLSVRGSRNKLGGKFEASVGMKIPGLKSRQKLLGQRGR